MSDEMAAITAEEFFSEPDAPETEVVEEAPEAEPAAPEVKPDPAVDFAAKEAELKRKEAALNDWNMKLKEKERTLTPQAQPEEPQGDLPPLSDEAERLLDSYIQRKYGEKFSAVDVLFQDTVETELETFAASKGIEPETLRETLQESGIQPREFSRKGLREAFTTAYDIHKARTFDVDSERNRLKEEILADLKASGVRIDSIEPSGRVDLETEAGDVVNNDEISPSDKYQSIINKLGKKG